MNKNHPCNGCIYFYGHNAYSTCCNYILVTGHRRPCPPGKQCTVRRDRKKEKSTPKE